MKKSFFSKTGITLAAVFAAVSMSTAAYSQTVTVSATQTANGTTVFNNLQDAINSFAVGGVNNGNAAPDIINVRADQGAIQGTVVAVRADATNPATVNLELTENLTIQGVDAGNNPSLAVYATGVTNIRNHGVNHSGTAAIYTSFLWLQNVNLTIKNIAFIPKDFSGLENPVAASSFAYLKAPHITGAKPVVNFENVVMTANDGNDMPLTTTGSPADDVKLSNPGVITQNQGSCGMWVFSQLATATENYLGGEMTVNLKNSVVAIPTPIYGTSSRYEVIKGWSRGNTPGIIVNRVNILEGCVFAGIDGSIIQNTYGSFVSVKGSESNPVIIRDCGRTAGPALFWNVYYTADDQPSACELENIRFYNNRSIIASEGGIVGNRNKAFINSIKNVKIGKVVGADGIELGAATTLDSTGIATSEITIDNLVMHDVDGTGSTPSIIYASTTQARNVNISNSVFTSTTGTNYALVKAGATSGGTWNVSNSILSLQGSTALAGQTAGANAAAIVLDPTVSDVEVTYLNTDNPFSSDFLKVSGSDVRDWSVY